MSNNHERKDKCKLYTTNAIIECFCKFCLHLVLSMEYGLIGEKLSHSFSKPIHEKLADYTYEITPLSKEEFTHFMERKDFKAINVTIPYKCDVIPYLSHMDERAKKIGAVNTVVNKDGELYGYNTDFFGFLYTLLHNQITIEGKKVLVLGNGGSAKAVFAVLEYLNASNVIVVKYKKEANVLSYEEAAKLHADADVIINTSPVGMYPNVEDSPIDLTPYQNLSAVVDLIYNPLTTKLMEQARTRSIKAVNGLEMLVAQAKYAVEYFLEKTIDDAVIEPIYEEILENVQTK